MARIIVETPDGQMPAYLALPETDGHLPVVLVHEAFGLNAHIESIADRLSEAGHPVIAPHLHYRDAATGVGYDEVPRAVERVQALSVAHIVADIDKAAAILPGSRAGFAVVGFCFGGAVAYIASGGVLGVQRAVAFYPVSIGNYWDEVGEPQVPLLTFFGSDDEFLGESELAWLDGLHRDESIPITVQIYPKTGHAFFNDARPDLYRAEPAADAWEATLAFLNEGEKE